MVTQGADADVDTSVVEHIPSGLAQFYHGDFAAAEKTFNLTADRDPAAASYAAKCRELKGTAPDGWRGVWVMTRK